MVCSDHPDDHPDSRGFPDSTRAERSCAVGRSWLSWLCSLVLVAGTMFPHPAGSTALPGQAQHLPDLVAAGGLPGPAPVTSDPAWVYWGMAGVVVLAIVTGLYAIAIVRLNRRLKRLADARERARQALAESETRYRLLAENATDMIWTASWPDLKLTYISPSSRRVLGLPPEDLEGRSLYERVVSEDRATLTRAIQPVPGDNTSDNRQDLLRPGQVQIGLLGLEDRRVDVETLFNRSLDESGRIETIQGSSRDITRRKRIENQRQARERILSGLARAARSLLDPADRSESMNLALAALGEAVGVDRVYVFENHADGETGELVASQRFEWVNDGVEPQIDNPDMQSMSYREVIPNWYPVLAGGEAIHGLVRDMEQSERELLESQGIVSIVVLPIMLEGTFWGQIGFDDCRRDRRWSQAEIDALQIAAGAIGGGIRSMYAERELQRLADTDPLTGVRSRRVFLERSEDAFRLARQTGKAVSLLVLDIDRFKWVNDNYGHPVGDEALKVFTRACASQLRSGDIMGRMGGEEFAVLLVGVGSKGARALAERLRKCVAETPVAVQSGEFSLTVSIGVAFLEEADSEFLSLLKRADKALYQAKNQGRDRVEVLH